MGRKNYSSKTNRRNTRADLARPLVMPDLGATVVDVYTVTLTNGSAVKPVEVYSTKAGAWAYAELIGATDPGGYFWPATIRGKGARVPGTAPAFVAA